MLRLGSLEVAAPAVMGILNVTPDSFSDGGRNDKPDVALRQAAAMVEDGAAIIDIGGESTRPGAKSVSEQEELDRVVPVVESIRAVTDVPISVDTSKPLVMREAVEAGAAMINDVLALRTEGALTTAVSLDVPVCLMHMRGTPRTMQEDPQYRDVIAEVRSFLAERVDTCIAAGLAENLIVIDPGFGFGKSHAHNVELLANLRQLRLRDRPLLVGLSRKSTLGALTGRQTDERLPASVAAAVIAAMQGADIIRAHDVKPTVDALKVVKAVRETGGIL